MTIAHAEESCIAPAPAMPTDQEAVKLLESLARVPSASGQERGAVEEFARFAARFGLGAEIDDVGNGIATRGATEPDALEIVLLGHIDTVPGHIPVRLEDGVLHGRGSVDAKGPLAAMLIAAARARLHPRARVRVIAAVGEETPESPGARHVAGQYRPAACIIGEPSGAAGFALGYKGRLLVRARFESESSHSAGPNGSTCDAALEWWERVRDGAAAMAPAGASAFDSVQASIRSMSSGGDGLAEWVNLDAGFRLPPAVTPIELEEAVRLTPAPGASMTFAGHTPAFRAPRGNDVAAALSAAIRAEGMTPRPLLKTGTADMNIVGPAWGCPIAAYGPGDSALDHTAHERIELSEYLRAIRVLTTVLTELSERIASAGMSA